MFDEKESGINKIILPSHYQKKLNDWEFIGNYFAKNILSSENAINIHHNKEYAFYEGTVSVGTPEHEIHAFMFRVESHTYTELSGKSITNDFISFWFPKSTNEHNFFVATCLYVRIGKLSDGRIDFHIERPTDGQGLSHEMSDEEMKLAAMKRMVFFDIVQQAALQAKTRIIKLQSDEKRNFDKNSKHNPQKKSITLKGGIVFSTEYSDKRPYNRHVEAWDVKGHYRTYKSGKTVYIKPFRKGAGKVNDKKYVIPF